MFQFFFENANSHFATHCHNKLKNKRLLALEINRIIFDLRVLFSEHRLNVDFHAVVIHRSLVHLYKVWVKKGTSMLPHIS
jgi:hypothetical protein